MCVERAVLTQNLLKSLNINSAFKSSGILRNNIKEGHCYNLVKFNGRYYIFDTSIPNLIDNQISPLIAEIDEETFASLSSPIPDIGISVAVKHYNPYRNVDVTIIYDSGREKLIRVDPLEEPKTIHL